MTTHVLARWGLLVGADVGAQIAFKTAGARLDGDASLLAILAQGAHSPWVAAGFALYLVTFALWMTILRDDDLSRVFPMTAITSVASVCAGIALFHESLSGVGLAGIASIVTGVVLLARDDPA